jgi:hypothetical protein
MLLLQPAVVVTAAAAATLNAVSVAVGRRLSFQMLLYVVQFPAAQFGPVVSGRNQPLAAHSS